MTILAVQMFEHCPSKGNLRRSYSYGGHRYEAGSVVRSGRREITSPSPIYEVSSREEFDHLTGRDADGLYCIPQPKRPNQPTFRGWEFADRAALDAYAQKDMETKARLGSPAVRAEVIKPRVIAAVAPKPADNPKVVDKLSGETVNVPFAEQRDPQEPEEGKTDKPSEEPVKAESSGQGRTGDIVDVMGDMTTEPSEPEDKPSEETVKVTKKGKGK